MLCWSLFSAELCCAVWHALPGAMVSYSFQYGTRRHSLEVPVVDDRIGVLFFLLGRRPARILDLSACSSFAAPTPHIILTSLYLLVPRHVNSLSLAFVRPALNSCQATHLPAQLGPDGPPSGGSSAQLGDFENRSRHTSKERLCRAPGQGPPKKD